MKAVVLILMPLGLISLAVLFYSPSPPTYQATYSAPVDPHPTNTVTTIPPPSPEFASQLVDAIGIGNSQVAAQKNPPSDCKEKIKKCLLRSYAEYKKAMITKFGFWRDFERIARKEIW